MQVLGCWKTSLSYFSCSLDSGWSGILQAPSTTVHYRVCARPVVLMVLWHLKRMSCHSATSLLLTSLSFSKLFWISLSLSLILLHFSSNLLYVQLLLEHFFLRNNSICILLTIVLRNHLALIIGHIKSTSPLIVILNLNFFYIFLSLATSYHIAIISWTPTLVGESLCSSAARYKRNRAAGDSAPGKKKLTTALQWIPFYLVQMKRKTLHLLQ